MSTYPKLTNEPELLKKKTRDDGIKNLKLIVNIMRKNIKV